MAGTARANPLGDGPRARATPGPRPRRTDLAPADAAPMPAAQAAGPAGGLRLGGLESVVGYHLAQATVTTMASFERHVGRTLNLRKVEYSLLLLLLANAPPTPKQLGQALALTGPNLTLLLDRMQARGLVQRERSQTDRRSQLIVLTAEGRSLAEAGLAAVQPMEQALDNRLSPAERLMLVELLRKVAGR